MMMVPGASRVALLIVWRFPRAGISATLPSSSEGAACWGGADCTGPVRMNGKIGSGEASADAENAIVIPAPRAAMRLSLDACTLNMGRPPFDRLRAHFGALLAASLRGGGFRTFA